MRLNEFIDLKDHEIKASYANKKLSIEGKGQVKLQNKFELINYKVNNNGSNFKFSIKYWISELDIKNQNLIKEYLPSIKINSKNINNKLDIIDLVILSKLEKSKSEIRRLIKGKRDKN